MQRQQAEPNVSPVKRQHTVPPVMLAQVNFYQNTACTGHLIYFMKKALQN
jgi:hypothetical protein